MTQPLAVSLVGVNTTGYRSLALDYLQAAALADPRFDVAINRFDTGVDLDPWWTAYRILTLEPQPRVLAIPVMCWTAAHVMDVARLVKAERPDILIVLGGPEVGPIAEKTLDAHAYVDMVVRGEGERAFADLLHSIARGGDFSTVPGVTARAGNEIFSAPHREAIVDLDSLPSPYAQQSLALDGSAYVETYRGCPHRCAYCFEGKGSTQIRSFSWERIKSDIDTVANTPGMKSFSFIDPVFNLTSERLGRLADILEPHARRGIRLHTIEVDIERIDDAQAAHLVRAGVVSVETGPQSVGVAALECCNRSFDRDRFAAGVEACKRAGISVECDLIIGLPGDTPQDIVDGVDFAIALDPGRVQLSTLHVLPGTVLWDRASELGLVFDDQPPHEVVSTRELPFAELRRIEVLGQAAAKTYQARINNPRSRR